MSDLVERLRDAKRIAPGWKSYEPNPLCQEAADEIVKLRDQLAAPHPPVEGGENGFHRTPQETKND